MCVKLRSLLCPKSTLSKVPLGEALTDKRYTLVTTEDNKDRLYRLKDLYAGQQRRKSIDDTLTRSRYIPFVICILLSAVTIKIDNMIRSGYVCNSCDNARDNFKYHRVSSATMGTFIGLAVDNDMLFVNMRYTLIMSLICAAPVLISLLMQLTGIKCIQMWTWNLTAVLSSHSVGIFMATGAKFVYANWKVFWWTRGVPSCNTIKANRLASSLFVFGVLFLSATIIWSIRGINNECYLGVMTSPILVDLI